MSDLPQRVSELAGRTIVSVETPTQHFDTFDSLHAFTSLRLVLDDGTVLTLTPGHEYKESHTSGYKTVTVDRRERLESLPTAQIKERHEALIGRLEDIKTEMNDLGDLATPTILRNYEDRIISIFREAQAEIPLLTGDGVKPSAMELTDNVRQAAGEVEQVRRDLVSAAYKRERELKSHA